MFAACGDFSCEGGLSSQAAETVRAGVAHDIALHDAVITVHAASLSRQSCQCHRDRIDSLVFVGVDADQHGRGIPVRSGDQSAYGCDDCLVDQRANEYRRRPCVARLRCPVQRMPPGAALVGQQDDIGERPPRRPRRLLHRHARNRRGAYRIGCSGRAKTYIAFGAPGTRPPPTGTARYCRPSTA